MLRPPGSSPRTTRLRVSQSEAVRTGPGIQGDPALMTCQSIESIGDDQRRQSTETRRQREKRPTPSSLKR